MKTVWVTGASGFLGRHMARHFAAEGFDIGGIDFREMTKEELRREGIKHWVQGDLTRSSLESLARLTDIPDAVFHLAGGGSVAASYENPLRDFHDNTVTTANVLDFLRREAPGAVFILASSAAVYGVQGPGPIPEDAPPNPVSPYGFHKLMAEQLCHSATRNYGLRVMLIRFFSLYGPELRKQLLWDLASRLALNPKSVELSGTGRETRDMFYIEDAVRLAAHLLRVEGDRAMVVNGGSGEASTVREVASALIRHLGVKTDVEFNGQGRKGDPENYQAEMKRAKSLGYEPRWSIEKGIAEYVAWLGDIHFVKREGETRRAHGQK